LDEESLFLKKQRLKWTDYEVNQYKFIKKIKFSGNQHFLLEWNERKVDQLREWQNLKLTNVSSVSAA
jgi:hypothetical protein